MDFKSLNIIAPIISELDKLNIKEPTPIQIDAIPQILAKKDVLAKAATGTGKTAAFVIPLLQMMEEKKIFSNNNRRQAKVLVVSPNRELSIQISESFKKIGYQLYPKIVTIIGGVYQRKQLETLSNNVDVLVVTPGRCRDLIEQRKLNLSEIEYFVLDEVDLILDMGFIDDIKFIRNSLKNTIQTIFLSATIPSKIKTLAEKMLHDYAYIQSKIDLENQGEISEELYFMEHKDKKFFLLDLVKNNLDKTFIIFSNMKKRVDEIEKFFKMNDIFARSIHSDKSQFFRQEAIRLFKSKKVSILIATDIAARGIHIDNINYVINFDLPKNSDVYVHRKGRTGRAGESGHSLLLCSKDELSFLKQIIKNVSPSLLPNTNHKWHIDLDLASAFAARDSDNVFKRKYKSGGNRFSNSNFKNNRDDRSPSSSGSSNYRGNRNESSHSSRSNYRGKSDFNSSDSSGGFKGKSNSSSFSNSNYRENRADKPQFGASDFKNSRSSNKPRFDSKEYNKNRNSDTSNTKSFNKFDNQKNRSSRDSLNKNYNRSSSQKDTKKFN